MSNAIKFSPENGIVKVKVQTEERINSDILVTITVADYGIGISEEDKNNLFKPYFSSSDETSKNLNPLSHGLGLSFCHRICAGLNGSLKVKSEIGEGS